MSLNYSYTECLGKNATNGYHESRTRGFNRLRACVWNIQDDIHLMAEISKYYNSQTILPNDFKFESFVTLHDCHPSTFQKLNKQIRTRNISGFFYFQEHPVGEYYVFSSFPYNHEESINEKNLKSVLGTVIQGDQEVIKKHFLTSEI